MLTLSTFPPKYHRGGLRDALVAAALALLEEGGSAALSLREAARRAGVSAMAPYRHFADREALLAAVATVGFERFRKALAAADASARGRDALIAQGVAYVDFACTHPALFRLMFGAASTFSVDLAAAGTASYAVLANRAASLTAPEQAADYTLACWSLVHGLAMLALDGRLPEEDASPPIMAERLLRLFGSPH